MQETRGETAAAFLRRFLESFSIEVHTVLSDNGSEWTDRFAVDKKNKPKDRPSGDHPVDRSVGRGFTHKLTIPFRPQTNGMVERFNRRIGEHLERLPRNGAGHHRRFDSHAERNAYLLEFVHNYNRTRLKCLDYKAPIEAVNNLPGPNTIEGECKDWDDSASLQTAGRFCYRLDSVSPDEKDRGRPRAGCGSQCGTLPLNLVAAVASYITLVECFPTDTKRAPAADALP